jgi:5-methyltetrahydropteroyltriglutamate--homocysteine methyltransferase
VILTTHTGSLPRPRADYTIYVKDRLTGFAGESASWPNPDAEEFPEWTEMARQFAPPFQRRPACTGPVAWKDWPAVERDIQTSRMPPRPPARTRSS